MEMLAYGEDALTFWAMKNRLPVILQRLNDSSDGDQCQLFFRPSFGRKGGENSSQFGEFDFILLTETCIYLGESKWHRSGGRIVDGLLTLRSEQLTRHRLFKFHIEEWAFGDFPTRIAFEGAARARLATLGLHKPIAPTKSRLAQNLRTILKMIKQRYAVLPTIKNILLFLHDGTNKGQIPQSADPDFDVVAIDYSEDVVGNFIKL